MNDDGAVLDTGAIEDGFVSGPRGIRRAFA